MQRDRTASAERLLHDVGWAMKRGLGPRDLIPMLKKLVAHAPESSEAWLFGMRELGKILVGPDPWQAARLARRVLARHDDYESWGVLGLALSVLGHYRAAIAAYRRAHALDPGCPVVLHNLGHLLDIGLDEPESALGYLAQAHRLLPTDTEIAGSYALALARAGRRGEALALLATRYPGEDVATLLDEWLERAG